MTGRLWEIEILVNETYFDRLPNINDTTGNINGVPFHDYHIKVPNITFGVPYVGPNNDWLNKIYWTSGYSTNTTLKHIISSEYQIEGAKIITSEQLQRIREIAGQTEYVKTNLEKFYANLTENFDIDVKDNGNGFQTITYDMRKKFDLFPIPRTMNDTYKYGPDKCKYYFILKQRIDELPFGSTEVTRDLAGKFLGNITDHCYNF